MRLAIRASLLLAATGCEAAAPDEPTVTTPADPAPAAVVESRADDSAEDVVAASEQPDEPAALRPATPEAFRGLHVLVPAGVVLRTMPGEPASLARLHLDDPDDARTMEVVGHDGQFLAVRPALLEKRCTPQLAGLADYDVKLWIAADAVAPVLGLATRTTLADGTNVEVSPGVPIRGASRQVAIDAAGRTIAVPVPERAIGTAFDPGAWTAGEVRRCAVVTSVDGQRVVVDLVQETAEPELAPLVSTFALDPVPRSWTVGQGVTVWWPEGANAGITNQALTFRKRPRRVGDLRCFSIALSDADSPPEDARLSACFESTSVHEHAPVDPLALSGPILGVLGSTSSSSSALSSLFAEVDAGEIPLGLLDEATPGSGLGTGGLGGGGVVGGIADIGGSIETAASSVSIEPPSVEGSLAADDVEASLLRHGRSLRRCHEKELETNEAAAGGMRLSMRIDAMGRVEDASIDDDTVGGDVGDCIALHVRKVRFAAASDATNVTVRLLFSAL